MEPEAGPIWLVVSEAAERGRCSNRIIYAEIRAGRLRAARIGGRRQIRIKAEWVDDWLVASSTPVPVVPRRP